MKNTSTKDTFKGESYFCIINNISYGVGQSVSHVNAPPYMGRTDLRSCLSVFLVNDSSVWDASRIYQENIRCRVVDSLRYMVCNDIWGSPGQYCHIDSTSHWRWPDHWILFKHCNSLALVFWPQICCGFAACCIFSGFGGIVGRGGDWQSTTLTISD